MPVVTTALKLPTTRIMPARATAEPDTSGRELFKPARPAICDQEMLHRSQRQPCLHPWYFTMIICLLVLFRPHGSRRWCWRRSRPAHLRPSCEAGFPRRRPYSKVSVQCLDQLVLLAAAAGLAALCPSGRWKLREPDASQAGADMPALTPGDGANPVTRRRSGGRPGLEDIRRAAGAAVG